MLGDEKVCQIEEEDDYAREKDQEPESVIYDGLAGVSF